jgi:diguanylate cyclase (GGDEF)-like protein
MRPLLLAIGLLGSAPFVLCLDGTRRITQYVHETWGVGDGLPQGSIQTLVQTRDGYLWLGTMEGLARFDGRRFSVFDRSTTPALPHNDIAALCEDRAGRLWVGTWGGLAVLENDQFRPVSLPERVRELPINSLVEGPDGALWIGTTKGLLRRDPGGTFITYTAKEGLLSEDITTLLIDREGTLWIATPKGLNRLSNGGLTSETAPALNEGVLALYEDRDASLWVTTSRGGLYLAPQKQFSKLARQEGLPNQRLWAVHQDHDGEIWVGTSTMGVMRRKNRGWERLSTKEGLSFDIVNAFYEDREGALWIGTDGGGLDRLRDGKVSTFGKPEGLPEEDVWTAFEDSRGTLWFGTAAGGLISLQGERIRQLRPASGATTKPMAEDSRGRLWVGGWGEGLLRLEKDRLVPQLRSPADITVLHPDRSGALWIGSEHEGLVVLREGRPQSLTSREGLPHDTVRAITEDRQGNVWVGTERGLLVLTGGRFEDRKVYTTRDGLPHDTVLDLYEDSEGVLWIGTYGGGLACFQAGRFTAFRKADGLFNDVIYKILEDRQGRFWLSSNKGIFTVARAELQDFVAGRRSAIHSTPYGTTDGMRSPECNGFIQPAGWKARDGRLYFPTIKGVVIVEPDRIKLNLLPPPMRLEQALLNDRALPRQDGIELGPGKKNLEFHYTALSLLDPPKVAFRYLLEGFNDDWVDAGTRRVAYYTNIPPGSYRFRVIAANNDGVWNHGGVSYAFRVRPHFYQTTTFYLLCGSGVGLLGFGVYRLRVKQLRERQHELEALVAERTRQLAASNVELETINDRLERANEQLERLATEDGLTGVFNRRHFGEVLDQEWKRATREGTEIALLMIDIDHFKKLNDTYGHPTGDECLTRVARAIKAAIHRPADLTARYGGEEFVVLLPDTSLEGAAVMGEKIRGDVEALAFPHRLSSYEHVTISCGAAALRPEPGLLPADLGERADRALYEAKESGRNRVVKTRAEG